MKQHDFIKDADSNDIVISDVKKKKLDIVPRLICLVFAIILWIYFVNINDSSVTATFKVRLDVTGADVLKNSSGQMMYGLDTQEVTITVKGTNRDLKKYSAADYLAAIDIGSVSGTGKHSIEVVPVLPSDTSLSLSVVSVEPQFVTFYTDIVETKTVDFEAVMGGEVTTPYQLNVVQNKTTVDITGPRSVIESIVSAKYSIKSGDYHTSTKFSGFKLSFFDQNGDSVPYDDRIITYSTDNTVVELMVTTEGSMGIDLLLGGSPLPSNITYSYDSITVIGDPTVILSDAVKNGKIKASVTQEQIDSGSLTVRVENEDLPTGVMLKEDYVDVVITFQVSQ